MNSSNEPILEIHNLSAVYGNITVVRNVSFFVKTGEAVAILGPNGAGKTTLLKAISNLIKPKSGEVVYRGDMHLENLSAHEIVSHGICQVLQDRGIFGPLTVLENLRLGAYTRERTTRWKDLQPELEKVFALFPILEERCGQLAGTLSGGQQQMLAIGRALMGSPNLLLLDEPSLGLSPIMAEEIFSKLEQLHSEGLSILVVEQNADLAFELAERCYVMEHGHFVLDGTTKDLISSDILVASYLGLPNGNDSFASVPNC
jgi:branched-chain amino acid transport system ATP-binding protein